MDSIALALHYDCHVTATDVSQRRVELAKANIERFGLAGRVEAKLGDAMALEFPDRSFDGAIANSVMLFLDHERACDELARVLRPGASFVLTNESMALSPLVLLSRKVGLGYRSRDLESHVRERLSPSKIEVLGARHFSRVEYVPHFGLLMQAFWGSRLLFDRLVRSFRHVDAYHKPEVACPSAVKKLDRALIEKCSWYRRRTWIAAIRFVR
jgi:ubiquinone/menaquinone biosynthesis C-methylase UbiE